MIRKTLFLLFFLFQFQAYSDSNSDISTNFHQEFFSSSTHGITGVINTPNARFSDEGNISLSLFRGNPERKVSLIFSPTDYLEAGIFYADIIGKAYADFNQSYKDKGFNFKFRIKQQDLYPAVAIGFNDIAGNGFYSSEYLVSSYKYKKIDFSLGVGWGNFSGGQTFKNPLIYLNNMFADRSSYMNDQGGNIDLENYFSGKEAALFGGIEYSINNKTKLKFEYDPSKNPVDFNFKPIDSRLNVGLDYKINQSLRMSIDYIQGNYFGIKFNVKNNISESYINSYKQRTIDTESKLIKLVVALQDNGISLEKLYKNDDMLLLNLRQNTYQSSSELITVFNKIKNQLNIDEEIIVRTFSNGNSVDVISSKSRKKKNDTQFKNLDLLYVKEGEFPRLFQNISPRLRTMVASREGFIKYGLFLEHDAKYMFSDSFFIESNLTTSLYDNFDELNIPPIDTYPAQVRSDIKKYLNKLDDGIAIKKLSINKFTKKNDNHYFYFSGGILEEMFNGIGVEYLNFNTNRNIAYGFDIFKVRKRDYEYNFEMLEYSTITGHANLFYKFGNSGMFSKISWGKYLAGDEGATIRLWKRFKNGAEMGGYVTFTDVSFEQFGEGSFDKGIFIKMPINFLGTSNFSGVNWRPLTKDPGSKLNKPYELYNDLKRFY